MSRRVLIVTAVVALGAFTGLFALGMRVLAGDRSTMHAVFARHRMRELEDAAAAFSADVAQIGVQLDRVATLLEHLAPPGDPVRDLRAMATVRAEYLILQARPDHDPPIEMIASAIPDEVLALARTALVHELELAAKEPDTLQVSTPLRSDEPWVWYRVFAHRPARGGATVAALVDVRPLTAKLRLLPDRASKLLVLGPHGLPASVSDPEIAALALRLADHPEGASSLGGLISRVRGGASGSAFLTAAETATIGLSADDAVAVAVPVRVEGGHPWTIVRVSSTVELGVQEALLVRRMVIGALIGLVLLGGVAIYVVVTARRSAVLRERLQSATQLAFLKDKADQAESRLVRSEKLVTAGQLAAGIAHEIGTPLNVARGRAELTLARLGSDHPQAAGQRAIIDQIDRVITLIRHLLDYVHPASSAIQPVPVGHALAAVADLLGAHATKRKISLVVTGSVEANVLADPGQLQQVLVNLAMNAIDACEPGGHVTLRATSEPPNVLIDVVDDGAGVPADIRARIFDPFFTTKKRGQGTGLGLWVVAELARAHQADIQLIDAGDSVAAAVPPNSGAELSLAARESPLPVALTGTIFRIKWPASKEGTG